MRFGPRRLRWPLPAALLLIVVLACVGLNAAESAPDPVASTDIEVSTTTAGQPLAPGFLGLSLEYSAIHRYLGRDAGAINPVFTQLVAALDPGQSPVLRIGGDSTDHSWWPLPGVLEPAGISYSLTRGWLATVHSAAVALDAHLILGVNLAADSPQLAGAEARALVHGIGRRHITALEIGNEPDLYSDFAWYRTRTRQVGFARSSSWTEPAYAREFAHWAAALPHLPLAGPSDAYTNWMSALPTFIAHAPRLGVVTFHRYPLRGCGARATGALAPTVTNLFAGASAAGLAASVAPYVGIAHAAGLPFRVDELNSASCGGAKGLSNTFAASLWVIDALFRMAAVGVDGVNLHTLPGAAYAPFSFRLSGGIWHATVNPVYYGMLMFARAFPAGAQLLSTTVGAHSPITAFATVDRAGAIHTILINETARTAVVRLRIAGRRDRPLRLERLTAPSLSATRGVALAGVSFRPGTTRGVLGPAHTTTTSPADGVYRIAVAADSAVLAGA